jgi:anaerobic selenocysteine-containing dehydrogenase
MDRKTAPSYCRFCLVGCPILVDVEDGRAVRVTGDDSNDVYRGYTCVKGRALPEQHYHPERLLHSQKRTTHGGVAPIASAQMLDEMAARLSEIIDRHGPASVALYYGTMVTAQPTVLGLAHAFMRAIGSPWIFNPASIDSPGRFVARALHGSWGAPIHDFDDPDVALVVGANPIVSFTPGLPLGHPGQTLKRWSQTGFDLIVVDPRRSDYAKRATIHLQPRPGEDAAILAGIVRVILDEQLHDDEFVAENVSGVERLREVVAGFTPEQVAARADIDPDDLVAAARTFARGTRGIACAGTGPHMSGPGTLVEYLVMSLNTLCGRWMRAGETAFAPSTLMAQAPFRAQAQAPTAGHGLGAPLPGTEVRGTHAGPQIASLPAAILHDGEDRIRALVSVSANPAGAWPDQLIAVDALKALDLLVQVDITMSHTAQLADYVVAPKMSLETPSMTLCQDGLRNYLGMGYGAPWAQYTHAIVDPPAGSDLLEEWELFYELGRRMGLQLEVATGGAKVGATVPLDMASKPTTDELLDLCATGSRVPLDEVRCHPHGAEFPDPPMVVGPKDPDCTDRLEVADPSMMADLEAILTAGPVASPAPSDELPFRLLCRRLQQTYNSSGRRLAGLRKRPYNPAFMHSDDLAELGLRGGDIAEIRSERAAIVAVVEPDDGLRRGLVSITHGFGGLPGEDDDVRRLGSNVGRLLSAVDGLQPYTYQPLMSNIPVAVRAVDLRADESIGTGAPASTSGRVGGAQVGWDTAAPKPTPQS